MSVALPRVAVSCAEVRRAVVGGAEAAIDEGRAAESAWAVASMRWADWSGLVGVTGNVASLVPSHSRRSSHFPSPNPPFGKNVCLPQKHAVELLRRPNNPRWSSSVASGGSLMRAPFA
jgi:hypothetical protein